MQLRKSRLLLVISLCLAVISGISLAQDRQKTTFDYMTGKDGLVPLVHVILHNGGTGTFVFDTGTNVNVIVDTLAKEINLATGPVDSADGSAVSIAGEQAQGAQSPVIVGSYLQQDTLFLLINASRLQLLSKQIDGILGWLFMHECAVLFDFHKHAITLWSPGNLTEKDLNEIGMEDSIILDQATPDTLGAFKITVRLNNQVNVDLPIDTGSYDTVIPTQVAHQFKLVPIQRHIPYKSVYGPIPSEAARLDSVAFGPIRIRSQEVYYATKQDKPGMAHLGLDILSHFRVLIDFSGRKLYLKPEQEESSAPKGSKNGTKPKASGCIGLSRQQCFLCAFDDYSITDTGTSYFLPNRGAPLNPFHIADCAFERYWPSRDCTKTRLSEACIACCLSNASNSFDACALRRYFIKDATASALRLERNP